MCTLSTMVAVANATDWPAINAAAREQAKTPVRAGAPGGSPFWNAHAKAFIHPPAFEFSEVEEAKSYRFSIVSDATWLAPKPWLPVPSAVWDTLAPGYYTLRVEALGADGAPLAAPAAERRFYRAAVFHGPYPAAPRDYREAATRVYASVYNLPHVQAWLNFDDPPPGYDLYCYPAKILSSMIRALCRHAAAEPKDTEKTLAIACRMADWLIAHSQPEDAPLAHFPPTYWGDRRDVAVKYAGQNMLLYPAHAALAFFDLAEALSKCDSSVQPQGRAQGAELADRYRDAALAITRTYVKLQGEDGTWPLKVLETDGSPVRANRLVPGRYILGMFDRVIEAVGEQESRPFVEARDRAFAYVLNGPVTTWNWDGQFEDMDPMPPYQNLQKGVAVDTALRLFALGRNAEACELVDWCEDQFTVWSDPIHHMDWKNWKTPTALEQYDYYTPIDASMGDMVRAFSAAYTATGNPLYREKARALADNLVRNQRADGTIPTYFDSRGGSDWVNCMVYAASCLELAAVSCPASPMPRLGPLNVLDFGAVGDGVTDDTAAFQAAIDAVVARRGGKIVVPYSPHGYRIAGPGREFIEGRPCRGQLVIPPVKGLNIAFEGEMPCKLLYSYQVRPPESVKLGFTPTRFGMMGMPNTCLFSDWTPPEEHDPKARPWTILATVEGDSCKGKFSVGLVSIANLEFRAHLDKETMYPKGGCVNLQNSARAIVRDSQFCLDDNVGDTILGKSLQPNPCHTVGLMMSGDQNDNQVLNNVAVQGFRYGLVLGEHVVADYLYVHNCEEGIVFHDASHLSVIHHVVAQHDRVILATAPNGLFGHAAGSCNVIVDSVDMEPGLGLLPEVSRLVAGVSDPGNRLRGSLVWHPGWGDAIFPVVGAKDFRVERFGANGKNEP